MHIHYNCTQTQVTGSRSNVKYSTNLEVIDNLIVALNKAYELLENHSAQNFRTFREITTEQLSN